MSLAGKMLYHLWHRPVGAVRKLVADGGPFERRRTERGQREMAAAAHSLPLLPVPAGAALELHLLTGKKYWYQTAFCLWTFARHAGRPLAPVIYDDGTLTDEFRAPLARLFPATRFVSQMETIARLDASLPAAKFPTLRERWQNYPHIRKLTDVHLGRSGWKLVLDSDLLFFRRPELLISWLDLPERPLHAVDCTSSYGYSRRLMNELAGASVADLVNVGLTGLNSSELDWEKLEHWCRTLIARERTSYYLEQALVAMLVAGRSCTVAPAADYVTYPVPPEADDCRAVMHHYVDQSRRWYCQRNWRRVMA
ncbi:MAG TPA: glycosyl transferase family 2 [Candidatus Didemnitutus sp.]|nr:glycosyl transferase family 2 [Candidatus Didemnitutus sp.]